MVLIQRVVGKSRIIPAKKKPTHSHNTAFKLKASVISVMMRGTSS